MNKIGASNGYLRLLAASSALVALLAMGPARAADEVTSDRLLNANKEQGNCCCITRTIPPIAFQR
jgi:hypothetical protein